MAALDSGVAKYDFSIEGLRLDLQRPCSPRSSTLVKARGRKAIPSKPPPPEYQTFLQRSPKIPKQSEGTRSPTVSSFSPRLAKRKSGRKDKNGRLSPLEKLPVELLEHIFSKCLNVNLLRASPRLGTRLSTERMYKQFAHAVYCTKIGQSNEEKLSLSPPAEWRSDTERETIMKEREAMQQTRSLGLTWYVIPARARYLRMGASTRLCEDIAD